MIKFIPQVPNLQKSPATKTVRFPLEYMNEINETASEKGLSGMAFCELAIRFAMDNLKDKEMTKFDPKPEPLKDFESIREEEEYIKAKAEALGLSTSALYRQAIHFALENMETED